MTKRTLKNDDRSTMTHEIHHKAVAWCTREQHTTVSEQLIGRTNKGNQVREHCREEKVGVRATVIKNVSIAAVQQCCFVASGAPMV